MDKKAGGRAALKVVKLGSRKAYCASYTVIHWGPTRFFIERLLVAITIVGMMTILGLELDRVRVIDAFTYALAEIVTQIRLRL